MGTIGVLIVDDHPLYRQGTRNALTGHDDVAVLADLSTGREALDYCAAGCPDVVLLDLNLPDSSGLDVAVELRRLCPDAGIIALTAHDDDAYVTAIAEAGGRGYLLKSATDQQLLGAIRAVAAGRSVFDPAVTEALLRRARGETPDSDARLTGREKEVLHRAAEGLTNRQIGHGLGISERTVQAHLSHIYDKLGVASRTEATTVALRQGLIELHRRR